MRRAITIGFLLAIVTPLAAVAVLQPGLTQSHLVAFSDFRRAAPGVYVEPAMPDEEVEALLAQVDASKRRVASLFGGAFASAPTIIAGADEVAMRRYMGNRAGATHATPMGSFVVIGPDGLNLDVISHELVHAEHHARVGYMSYWLSTPMWFIEGPAMQVDLREKYADPTWHEMTDGGRRAPELDEMRTGRGFANGDLTANYATAKHEVARWIAAGGRATVPRFLARMSEGADFEASYGARGTP